jgi:hypothetical protein
VNVHHGDEAKIPRMMKSPPFLACKMSKWLYDTSTSTATRVARCGSLFGVGLSRLILGYE